MNYGFFMTFPFNKQEFSIRFSIDIYHMLFFLINGIFISDYYLSNNFERYFTSKFMDYANTEHPRLRNKARPKDEENIFS